MFSVRDASPDPGRRFRYSAGRQRGHGQPGFGRAVVRPGGCPVGGLLRNPNPRRTGPGCCGRSLVDKFSGLLPSPEDDLNLPTGGVELEKLRGIHEAFRDIGDDDVPTVPGQHVIVGLLAEFVRLFFALPAALPGNFGSGTQLKGICLTARGGGGFGNAMRTENPVGAENPCS